MTKDEIIETLEDCRNTGGRMAYCERQHERLSRRREQLCTKKPAGDRNGCENKVCFKMCESVDSLADKLKTELQDAIVLEAVAYDILKNVEKSVDRQLLTLHYIEGQSWEEVSKNMSYSLSFIMKHRRRALDTLADLLGQ